jgi:hypothetical protein
MILENIKILTWEFDHIRDLRIEQDIEFIPFPGSDRISRGLRGTETYQIPDTIFFINHTEKIQHLDYPYSLAGWIIMSTKMIEILEKQATLNVRKIKVVVLDAKKIKNRDLLYSDSAEYQNAIIRSDFLAIQLLEHQDVLDLESTEYAPNRLFPNVIDPLSVQKYAFSSSLNKLPPIFRLKNVSQPLFITPEARESLRINKIIGVGYDPINKEQPYEVDIKV